MGVFISRFPAKFLIHHLLCYMGNAVEMNKTFHNLFNILKLEIHKNKVFRQEGRDLSIMLATASIALSRNCEHNVYFVDCACMHTHAHPGADFVTPCGEIFQSRQIAR